MNNNTDLWKKSKHLFLAAVNSHDFLSRAVDDLNLVWEDQVLPKLVGSAKSGQVVVLRSVIGEFIVGFQEKSLFNQTAKIVIQGAAFHDTVAAFFRAWNFFLMIPEFLWDVVGNQAEHKAAIERFFEFERQTIQKRKAELDGLTPAEKAQAKDLIAVFFREGETFSKNSEFKDEVVTDENIRELVHEALLGSLDTSWNTLCMVIWHMAHNQDVQDKLRAEIREFLHRHPRVALSNINERLPYLEAVITEVLRYAPTANMVFKSVNKDTSLGGYQLDQGQTLFFHTEGITTNPKHFKSPEKFDPERFLSAKYGEVDHKIVFPFGQGRRICPGQSLGTIQLRYFIILFFSKFKITTAPGNPSKLKSKYEIIRAVHQDSTKVFVELA
jgi:cytochrome P450